MTRALRVGLLLLALLPGTPAPAAAQVERAVIGGGVGVLGGAAVTMAVVVARARLHREYLDSAGDLIHWQSTPMIAAPAAGVVFGLAGEDALMGSMAGSMGGLLIGAAAGAGLGWFLSEEQEWPWAGGVIGGGVGLAAGGLVGGLFAWSRDEDADLEFPAALRMGLSIPIP